MSGFVIQLRFFVATTLIQMRRFTFGIQRRQVSKGQTKIALSLIMPCFWRKVKVSSLLFVVYCLTEHQPYLGY